MAALQVFIEAGVWDRMSNLIPVKERADITERSAPFIQEMYHKLKAPTGALLGAAAGFHEGGIWGALLGLTTPALLGNPAAQMFLARALHAGGKGLEKVAPHVGQALLNCRWFNRSTSPHKDYSLKIKSTSLGIDHKVRCAVMGYLGSGPAVFSNQNGIADPDLVNGWTDGENYKLTRIASGHFWRHEQARIFELNFADKQLGA